MGEKVTALGARRLLMGGQGLLASPGRRIGPRTLQRQIESMGFVQIDTISAAVRAHHHILLTRFHDYRPELLKRLLEKERALFEHWTHDASIIPSRWLSHWTLRFERYRRAPRHKWWHKRMGPEPERVMDHVRRRIQEEGPLLSRDFEREEEVPHDEVWWGWKPEKTALEHLWRCGELAVHSRVNFQKAYDLFHRVFPDLEEMSPPPEEHHVEWACASALERLGTATPGELAAFWNAVDAAQAKRWAQGAVKEGRLVEVEVHCEDSSPPRRALAWSDWKRRLRALPQPPGGVRLLSPFDPVIRDRQRCRRLFGFDYRFEAFVPKAKRRFGYYVLPILKGDRLIGRLDAKLHRDKGQLEIKGLWWEDGLEPTARLWEELTKALLRLACFGGAETLAWPAGTEPRG
ncbi:MAG TPA: crosslink repair DNA glycosylase YcaQ family protein [Acidobacteriota bacterium]|nr:crosslink repair DNA glycosylase YcaQ family protein [Acidobacteriota bacterium]